MPVLFGVILGVVLTAVGAYVYDTGTGRASSGLPPSAANEHPPMVNWDVVSDIWRDVKIHFHDASAEVERGWKRLTS